MTERKVGKAWEMFAIMEGDNLIAVVARDPTRPQVVDITEQIGDLIAQGRTPAEQAKESDK